MGWPYAVQSPSYPWGAETPKIPFVRAVQLVRCPLDTINSFLSHKLVSFRFLAEHCPNGRYRRMLVGLMPKITAAARGGIGAMPTNVSLKSEELGRTVKFSVAAWLCWNQHIESYAAGRVMLERLDVRALCLLGGFGSRCPNLSTPISAEGRRRLKEEELLQSSGNGRRLELISKQNPNNQRANEHPHLTFEAVSGLVGPHLTQQLLNMSSRYGYQLSQGGMGCSLLPRVSNT